MSPTENYLPGFLALELDGDGAHPAAWRAARHTPAELLTGDRIRSTVLAAESAGFQIATFSDGPVLAGQEGNAGLDVAGRLDAVQRAAFAAPLTHSIILVPEVDTVYTEPFHVATQLASLDYVSGGRAGWLVAASGTEREGAAVGRAPVEGAALAAEAAASVEVSRKLWDSWEDDAVIRDVESGRYLDVDKLHYADFETGPEFPGTGYSVKGPAIIPRPLQGQLPVVAPYGLIGGDGDGLEGGGLDVGGPDSGIDAVLVRAREVSELAAEVTRVRTLFAGQVAVIAELDVVLDARGQSAAARIAQLDSHTPWHSSGARYTGNAEGLVEVLTEILATAHGVRLHPAVLDVDLDELARLVLPVLRRRGVLAPTTTDATFRDLLGLDRPLSRYAAVEHQSVDF
ncbi:nitrilotriacetate monooxygenase [Arthrobacter alpinus]|uniref:Nitrilotriacetate monooxygenase n=1 Tax=Arthrobacter alpinus TaxID=656366 RepID=A0A0S2LYJ5_9MICC|nr:LLM class flavin-dependent oxidoreductase [Arthrobacter alpinus]ALO66541.1 nitrilotriacetate monooxygenase [Arthrobacter alpinus]